MSWLPSQRISWFTWNARALMTSNGEQRDLKMKYLQKLLASADFGLVQEVHGSRAHVDFVLKKHIKDHLWYFVPAAGVDGQENSRADGRAAQL
eukprot:7086267-Karenia_brevis.AAC.1